MSKLFVYEICFPEDDLGKIIMTKENEVYSCAQYFQACPMLRSLDDKMTINTCSKVKAVCIN